ncbi:hypothetical protein KKG31_07395 [Patescibacteria group bacterium]|nr:hypothetical protein [Patescibacteria group bacterium]MBU1758901.1 hypothetical protein [Patescibacteria group bacterium]
MPPRGKDSLEEYIAKVTESGGDLIQKAKDIYLLRHTEEMRKKSEKEKKAKEEEVKGLIDKLHDTTEQLKSSKEEIEK